MCNQKVTNEPQSFTLFSLNDTIRVKNKEEVLIIDPFIPFYMNFQTILMPKVNLAKVLSENNWSVRTILILSML